MGIETAAILGGATLASSALGAFGASEAAGAQERAARTESDAILAGQRESLAAQERGAAGASATLRGAQPGVEQAITGGLAGAEQAFGQAGGLLGQFGVPGSRAFQEAVNLALDPESQRRQRERLLGEATAPLAAQGLLGSGRLARVAVDIEDRLAAQRFGQLSQLGGLGLAASGQQAGLLGQLGGLRFGAGQTLSGQRSATASQLAGIQSRVGQGAGAGTAAAGAAQARGIAGAGQIRGGLLGELGGGISGAAQNLVLLQALGGGGLGGGGLGRGPATTGSEFVGSPQAGGRFNLGLSG